ncbi:hypothetical protein [Singulisphaera sp. PoT]|uniref:hypothetical protein n=1 Tax=Singulisphaera sp. PoT TaxID=3411797 RepID=UPI003BF60862
MKTAPLAIGLISLVPLLGISGCTPPAEPHPKTVEVKGKVSYQGRPLTRGTITFRPDDGRPALGDIQPDGSYTLSTFEKDDGAIIGHHRVSVSSSDEDPTVMPGSPNYRPARELIPKKYTTFESSGLDATVGEQPRPQNFDLK